MIKTLTQIQIFAVPNFHVSKTCTFESILIAHKRWIDLTFKKTNEHKITCTCAYTISNNILVFTAHKYKVQFFAFKLNVLWYQC